MEFLIMALIGLSLLLSGVVVIASIYNYRFKDTQLKVLLFVFVILLAAAGYMFDYQANTNNDLKRFILEFEMIRHARSNTLQILSKSHPFEYLYVVIAYLASFLSNYHWYPVICVLFEYAVYIYILSNESKCFNNQGLGIIVCVIFNISLIPPYMSIAAMRNIIAYALFSLGIYRLYTMEGETNKRNHISVLMLLGGALIHTGVLLSVMIWLLSLPLQKKQILLPVLLPWGALYAVALELFSRITGDFGAYAYRKGLAYLREINMTNINRTFATLPCVILVFLVCLVYLYCGKRTYSKGSVFILTQMAFAIGSAFIPTLFLRMCYPLGFLFPVIYRELQIRGRDEFRGQRFLLLVVLAASGMMFITTRFGWIRELVWEVTGKIR